MLQFRKHYFKYYMMLLALTGIILITGCQPKEDNNWMDVIINIDEAKKIQEEVNNGHSPDMLDPRQVAKEFLSNVLQLKDDVKMEQIEKSERGLIFKATYQNNTVELNLLQPVQKDSTGIWMVQKYRYIK